MRYLRSFRFPDGDAEWDYILYQRRTCYDSLYPFGVLSSRGLQELELSGITVLYRANGSGKTTALNVLAEALGARRDARYNRSSFFEAYVSMCCVDASGEKPEECRFLASDDVFDFMLNIRAANEGLDTRREALFREWTQDRSSPFRLRSMDDYDELRRVVEARSKTQSRFARDNMSPNIREHSNGESAYLFFTQHIHDNGLYLLDEPENSLSPEKQQQLAAFLEESVRFFGCQLVLATHSPFLLAMKGAKVYDLDSRPAAVRPWTELPQVRASYDFFQQHSAAFSRSGEDGRRSEDE